LSIYTALAAKAFTFTLAALWINMLLVGGTWVVVFKTQGVSWKHAFIYPLIFVNILYIAFISWRRSVFKKGYEWKGRMVY